MGLTLARYVARNIGGLENDMFRYGVFITLTSAEDVSGKVMRDNLNRLWQALKKHLGCERLYYFVAREVQERGVLHYHIVLFGVRYVSHEWLSREWGLGFVWIERFSEQGRAVKYVMKYVQKQEGARLHVSRALGLLFREAWVELKRFFRESYFMAYWLSEALASGFPKEFLVELCDALDRSGVPCSQTYRLRDVLGSVEPLLALTRCEVPVVRLRYEGVM